MSSTKQDGVERYLTPSKDEQVLLILQGKCPHNKGWKYDGHGHNSEAYTCILCDETKWW